MDALQLYKFVNDNELEFHWAKNEDTDDVVLFVADYHISDFNKLLGGGITGDEGLTCVMKDGYFCFWMEEICEYFDINKEEIFEKDEA